MEKKANFLNKKGSILDFFYIMPMLIAVGLCLFASFIIITNIEDIDIFQEDEIASKAVSASKNTILSFDSMMLFIIVGLSLFVIISSSIVDNHPAYFIISFILLCIAITVSAIVSNAWYEFYTSTQIAEVAANFPKLKFLFDNFPIYMAFMGIASLIAGYVGRNR